jgi:hypothetical protein
MSKMRFFNIERKIKRLKFTRPPAGTEEIEKKLRKNREEMEITTKSPALPAPLCGGKKSS